MPDLSTRSYENELLDRDDIPFADIKQNMKELNRVNTLLGGHGITIAGLKELADKAEKSQPISICEIGCGGGDNLNAIARWCHNNKVRTRLTGIDIKRSCTEYAGLQNPSLNATWITSDYASVKFGEDLPDIIFSSLFCHHFKDEELVSMMEWMRKNSSRGFFINDLQRNLIAYYLIKWLTRIFSKSYLVKNDAPLSVARGFKRKDWEAILHAAGISNYKIRWKWAFRYLITCKNE